MPVTFLSIFCLATVLTFFIGFVLTRVSSRQVLLLLLWLSPVLVVGKTPGNRIILPLGLFFMCRARPECDRERGWREGAGVARSLLDMVSIDGLSRFYKSGWVISRVTRSKRHGEGTPGQLALVCFYVFHHDAFNSDISHSCPTPQSLCIP